MNKQVKLIDANKVIEDIERRMHELLQDREADYDRFPVINALENFVGRLKSDMYAPDPITLPPLKPGDKVRHKDHEQWGIGKVLELSKSKKSAECRFEYTTTGTLGTFRRFEQAFYRLDKLELVEDKEDE
ncbi:DUF3553 domain-containing protein [Paenibacillus sp. USDA918EY]|uniref:DUF3553 domain-containing protein n=1 Tax=Paenibacillus sp. USDA918EY TaxID=2689575 RepID=UPI001359DF30|nr:DUF3553 domain-containing protein [Paenibacillus sp. USDA918EY]